MLPATVPLYQVALGMSFGIVIGKLKQEGDRVRTGDRIYTVADLRQLWVMLDAYESDLEWLSSGDEVESRPTDQAAASRQADGTCQKWPRAVERHRCLDVGGL